MPRDVCRSQGALTLAGSVSQALIAANPNRVELTVCNTGAGAMFLGFQTAPASAGAPAAPTAVSASGLRLGAGQSYTTTNYRGAVAIIGTPADVATWMEL